MSKTFKDLRRLDNFKAKKRGGEASGRFKREKVDKHDTAMFKREVSLLTQIIQSTKE
jgi:hypothetical protein